MTTERHLQALIDAAEKAVERDSVYWEELATGQDSEEAEASGALNGQLSGLLAAQKLMADDFAGAEACLDLYDRVRGEDAHPLTGGDA